MMHPVNDRADVLHELLNGHLDVSWLDKKAISEEVM